MEFPPPSVARAERDLAAALVPDRDPEVWAVAVMELGALVCTAASPACERCPIRSRCAWQERGGPPYDGPPRRGQTYDGTDRQCRGRLLAVLRDSDGVVPPDRLEGVWTDEPQRTRALAGLLTDGLVVVRDGGYSLPG